MKRRGLIAVASLIAVLSASLPAAADEASTHFQRGVELYSEADYRSALNEFRRAYELEPRWQVLYNIGMSEYQLLDYAGALQAFERYLRDGGSEVPTSRRSEVDRELGKLRGRVAKLDIVVNVPGAQVSVDDAPVGTTPFQAPVLVSAGRRRISVTAAGRNPASTTVDVVGGDTRKISVDLAVADPGAPPPSNGGPQPPPPPPPRSIPWIGWVATGVLAVGTGVTGGLALSASSDLKTKINTFGVSQADIDSAHAKTTALGITSDALLGATAVAAGISLYFTLRTPPPADTARRSVPTTLAIAPAGRGVRAEVTF